MTTRQRLIQVTGREKTRLRAADLFADEVFQIALKGKSELEVLIHQDTF